MKAAIYARVSTEEQAKEGYSIEAQISLLQDYCKLYNYEVYNVYCDAGISGSTIDNREELKCMLNEAKQGKFEIVLIWKLSRLSRSLKDILDIVDSLDRKHVSLISYSEKFDTSTPVGRMTLQILGSIAEFERSTTVENVKLAMESRAKGGRWNGGNTPFGYRYDCISKEIMIDDSEAEVVKKIFKLYMSGSGYFSICRYLNKSGYRTRGGKEFTSGAIKNILTNRAYCGFLVYNKYTYKKVDDVRKRIRNSHEIAKDGVFPPLIKREDFQYIQDILIHKDYGKLRSEDYILSSLLRCPECGGAMVGSTTTKGSRVYRYYKCSSYNQSGGIKCSVNSLRADKIERQVLKYAYDYIHNESVIGDLLVKLQSIRGDLAQSLSEEKIAKKIEENKNKKNKLLDLLLNDVIDENAYLRKTQQLEWDSANLLKEKVELELQDNKAKVDAKAVEHILQSIFILNTVKNVAAKKLLQPLIKKVVLNNDKSIKEIIFNF